MIVMRHTPEQLYCRRQFALGPAFLSQVSGWREVEIAPALRLTAHPDLAVAIADGNDARLAMLGEVVDPAEPSATNAQIAERLVGLDERDLFAALRPLAGRWAVVSRRGDSALLVHDAGGQQQVHFGAGWCCTQPGLVAAELGWELDPRFVEITQSYDFLRQHDYWLAGDASFYRECRLLTPNHVLDLNSGESRRYWPVRPGGRIALADAASRGAAIIAGTMAGMAARSPVTIPVTAGVDSRVTLAASRAVTSRCFFYTHKSPKAQYDVDIPAALLAKLGLEHHVLERPTTMDAEFGALLRRNHPLTHEFWGCNAQEVYATGRLDDHIRAISLVSEVGRDFYGRKRGMSITAKNLAATAGLGESALVLESLQGWIDGLGDSQGYDPLDLFYWEQRVGCWASLQCPQWAMVQDSFSPFNCRELLEVMLAVDLVDRARPEYRLHKRMIEILWPETLDAPFNPTPPLTSKQRFRRKANDIASHLGLLPLARRIKRLLKR
jgi:hypothetical protein